MLCRYGYKNQLEPHHCCKVPNKLLHADTGAQSKVVKLYKKLLSQNIIPSHVILLLDR
ncbi:hypothetical protein [Campylobacter concisus]|uniref:hypothetical protein n=1 Tax=Campylobacter concisus TaxID=199 RepID=UPI00131BC2E0|nr:hypothetical protein [Campylobacter concisus]